MRISKPIKPYGNWRIRWVDHLGFRQSKTFKTQSESQIFNAEIWAKEYKIKKGLAKPDLEIKGFKFLCDAWIKNRASLKRSIDDDKSIIRCHLLPYFGTYQLNKITTHVVDEFKLTKSCSPKTLHNILTLLISMLNYAVDCEWLESTPNIKKPKLFAKEKSYLKTDEMICEFLNTAKRLHGERVFVIYAAAIFTGAREGEFAALKWEHVCSVSNSIFKT